MNHRPVAIGMVLCEVVIVDVKTHNVTPVNCFTSRKLSAFPGVAEFHIVAWLADGLGAISLEIVVEALANLDEVYRFQKQLAFDDPLKDKTFTARIRNCPFPTAGQYLVSLLADGELVAHRKIHVHS